MSTEQKMPRYQCHKQVSALKIAEVRQVAQQGVDDSKDSVWELVPENDACAPVRVPLIWIMKHDPKPGGYYVAYDDNYSSYSPAAAFEGGYALVPMDYRDRVRLEKAQNDERIEKLAAFITGTGGEFHALPFDERDRLTRQWKLMHDLSLVLGARIAAFPA